MEQLPFYISIIFVLNAFLTILLLYKATNYSKSILIIILSLLAFQAIISLSGFYKVTNETPPRFALLLLPPIVLIVFLFITKRGKRLIDGFDVKTLTLLHIVRIPVELVLYWLYLHKAVPKVMTFEGRNFDILCGLTAPFVYYFGYIKSALNKNVLLVWNIACLLLLANIVIIAILSAPFSFQRFAFDQPNLALFYFPFVWLPCGIVPIALLAHMATIRRLITQQTMHKM